MNSIENKTFQVIQNNIQTSDESSKLNECTEIMRNTLYLNSGDDKGFKRTYSYIEEPQNILEHLDIKHFVLSEIHVNDLMALALVSKYYRRTAINELIKRLNGEKIFLNHLIKKIKMIHNKGCSYLRPVEIKVTDLFNFFGHSCSQITHLYLHQVFLELKDNDIKMISEKFTKIDHLSLKGHELTNKSTAYFEKMTSMEDFQISLKNHDPFDDFSFLQKWPKLSSLSLIGCSNIDHSAFKHPLPITSLHLSACTIKDLSFLKWCPHLVSLKITDCEQISDTGFFQHCPKLTYLGFTGCNNTQDISSLKHCTLLEYLNLYQSNNITNINFLEYCPLLKTLKLNDESFSALRDISPLKFCTQLKFLDLGYCKLIQDISALTFCTQLEYLSLMGCNRIVSIASLDNCRWLKTLNLRWCENIRNINSLQFTESLEELDLTGCKGIQDISSLQYCDSLQKIELSCAFKEENTELIKTYLTDGIKIEFDWEEELWEEEPCYTSAFTILQPRKH